LQKHINTFPLGFLGVFIFNKKSLEFFGGNKKDNFNPRENIEKEITSLLYKAKLL
jgi:hypothetical protein